MANQNTNYLIFILLWRLTMLSRQDVINAVDSAMSDTLTALDFEKKEATEKQLMQQTAEKISTLFGIKLNQLEQK